MSKYDEFDLDIQNTSGGNVTTRGTGYSVLSCPTQPVINCVVEASKRACPSDNCVPKTQATCPSGNCNDGTLERCPARKY